MPSGALPSWIEPEAAGEDRVLAHPPQTLEAQDRQRDGHRIEHRARAQAACHARRLRSPAGRTRRRGARGSACSARTSPRASAGGIACTSAQDGTPAQAREASSRARRQQIPRRAAPRRARRTAAGLRRYNPRDGRSLPGSRARAVRLRRRPPPRPSTPAPRSARRLRAGRLHAPRRGRAWPRAGRRRAPLRACAAAASPPGPRPRARRRARLAHRRRAHRQPEPARQAATRTRAAPGLRQLGVEVYGGVLLNSWLDRDLGPGGRAPACAAQARARNACSTWRGRSCACPQLAIHLNREITTDGLHLEPAGAPEPAARGRRRRDRRRSARCSARRSRSSPRACSPGTRCCHDAQPARLVGCERGVRQLAAPRQPVLVLLRVSTALLERLARPRAAALRGGARASSTTRRSGSTSARGAQSAFLRDVLERSVLARGGAREDFHRAIAASGVRLGRHGARHAPELPGEARARAPGAHERRPGDQDSTSTSATRPRARPRPLFLEACARAGVPCQRYVHRGDLACGSTIGPLTAADARHAHRSTSATRSSPCTRRARSAAHGTRGS